MQFGIILYFTKVIWILYTYLFLFMLQNDAIQVHRNCSLLNNYGLLLERSHIQQENVT
jgi:hypothetical protein